MLIRLSVCGVCHSDCHTRAGDWPIPPRLPVIVGHEGVGRVVAVGPDVCDPVVGDRVGLPWLQSVCGRCPACQAGDENLCPRQRHSGYNTDGAYAQYAVAPAACVARLPAHLTDAQAAPLLCAGLTSYTALRQMGLPRGAWIGVWGIGGLGHVAVAYGVAMGLNVAAVDVTDAKLALARGMGAQMALRATADDLAGQIQQAAGGRLAGVLVTAPHRGVIAQALGCLRRGGVCQIVGLVPGSLDEVAVFDVVSRGLTLRGSMVGPRRDLTAALALAAHAGITPHIEVWPLRQVNDILDRLGTGDIVGRAVLKIPHDDDAPSSRLPA